MSAAQPADRTAEATDGHPRDGLHTERVIIKLMEQALAGPLGTLEKRDLAADLTRRRLALAEAELAQRLAAGAEQS